MSSAFALSRFPEVEVKERTDSTISFVLSNTDASVANALRRVMIAEVPTLAIRYVDVEENSSVLHDEFLAHRLGLIPLRYTGSSLNYFEYPWSCSCSGGCNECTVVLEMDIKNTSDDPLHVTTKHLVSLNSDVVPVHFASKEEEKLSEARDGGIAIVTLGRNQRVKLHAKATKGVGKEHARHQPVCVATFHYELDIRLNEERLEKLSAEEKERFVEAAQPGVFQYNKTRNEVTLTKGGHLLVSNADELMKVASEFKQSPDDEGLVEISVVPDKYIFHVESTGALKPEDIVIAALDALRAKMETLRRKCREMAESGVVASSGPAGGPAFASGAGVGSDSSSVPSLGSGSSW